jgi:chemotaxis protein histidine kinase CheA
LTVSYPAFGEFQGQRHRLEHAVSKIGRVRVLTIGHPPPSAGGSGIEVRPTNGSSLSRFRIALKEGQPAALFICEELPGNLPANVRGLGFFTCDAETVDEIAEDIEAVAAGRLRRPATFDRLRQLHQTTQKVVRELESYSRRMDLAIRRARRRPDLLTPARFERIVRQSVAKMEQLKEIPRRALRTMDRAD